MRDDHPRGEQHLYDLLGVPLEHGVCICGKLKEYESLGLLQNCYQKG